MPHSVTMRRANFVASLRSFSAPEVISPRATCYLVRLRIQQHHILAYIELFEDRQEVQTSLGDIRFPDVMPQARDMNGFLELLRPQTRQTLHFRPIVGHHADLLFLDIERSHLPNRYKQPDDGWRDWVS